MAKSKKKVKKDRPPHKYKIIAKVMENDVSKGVSYHTSDLIKFVDFLETNFQRWFYFNVYDNQGDKRELGRFTINNKPVSKHI